MGEITFVRHGQANSQAKSEEEYDQLSPLGHRQAEWLGAYFRKNEAPFDKVLMGSLRRHHETTAGLGNVGPSATEDSRLDEMDYFNLGEALEERHGVPFPGPEEFAGHVPKVMEAWHNAEIQGRESFASFEARVTAVLTQAAAPGRRVLCVTSGGVIGMIARHLLGLDPRRMARILLPIRNTSIHRVQVTPHGNILSSFNAHPHLDSPERAYAKTTY